MDFSVKQIGMLTTLFMCVSILFGIVTYSMNDRFYQNELYTVIDTIENHGGLTDEVNQYIQSLEDKHPVDLTVVRLEVPTLHYEVRLDYEQTIPLVGYQNVMTFIGYTNFVFQ